MKITDVERFTIPLTRDFAGALPPKEGTTVEELIKALKKLPPKGFVNADFGNGDLIVMHYKPDIDPDAVDPLVEAYRNALRLPNPYTLR
jgi:hypothetical protein